MSIDTRLFIWLFFAFILATITGTLTHECGHYIVARWLGYDATLHYNFTTWKQPHPNSETNHCNSIWTTLGGPLETMLTGTIGLLFLFFFRKTFDNVTKLTFSQWLLIFISLFWLRQAANFFISIGGYFVARKFCTNKDEVILAKYLNLPYLSISVLTAIAGLGVLTVIIFKFVPTKQRITFIVSGLAGGTSGYLLWMEWLGKYLMP